MINGLKSECHISRLDCFAYVLLLSRFDVSPFQARIPAVNPGLNTNHGNQQDYTLHQLASSEESGSLKPDKNSL
jgi:hypothetical protein